MPVEIDLPLPASVVTSERKAHKEQLKKLRAELEGWIRARERGDSQYPTLVLEGNIARLRKAIRDEEQILRNLKPRKVRQALAQQERRTRSRNDSKGAVTAVISGVVQGGSPGSRR